MGSTSKTTQVRLLLEQQQYNLYNNDNSSKPQDQAMRDEGIDRGRTDMAFSSLMPEDTSSLVLAMEQVLVIPGVFT